MNVYLTKTTLFNQPRPKCFCCLNPTTYGTVDVNPRPGLLDLIPALPVHMAKCPWVLSWISNCSWCVCMREEPCKSHWTEASAKINVMWYSTNYVLARFIYNNVNTFSLIWEKLKWHLISHYYVSVHLLAVLIVENTYNLYMFGKNITTGTLPNQRTTERWQQKYYCWKLIREIKHIWLTKCQFEN